MLFTALIFFLILSFLVIVHELGHFFVARWVGVKVEEFGLGLPPRITGKKWKGILWSLNWLPIGGFVKLAGEDQDEVHSGQLKVDSKKVKQYFWARSKKERAAILLAGVSMNFLVAVGITAFLLTQGVHEPSGRVHVERVVVGSPADKAGILVGDIIDRVSFEGGTTLVEKRLVVTKDLIEFVKEHAGQELIFQVERGTSRYSLPITPRKEYPAGEGPTGIAISDLEEKVYPLLEAPVKAVTINIERGRDMIVGIGTTLVKLFKMQNVGQDVAGPIGIAQVTGQAVKFGWKAVLEFMSILSLNLALLNTLPIPALDGGRLLFVILEKILGHKVHPKFEQSAHQIGMIVLMVLLLLISVNDIMRLARGG